MPRPDGQIDAAAIETMIETFRESTSSCAGNRFAAVPLPGETFRLPPCSWCSTCRQGGVRRSLGRARGGS